MMSCVILACGSPVPRPLPDFISQPWRKIGCEIKSGSGLGTRLCARNIHSPNLNSPIVLLDQFAKFNARQNNRLYGILLLVVWLRTGSILQELLLCLTLVMICILYFRPLSTCVEATRGYCSLWSTRLCICDKQAERILLVWPRYHKMILVHKTQCYCIESWWYFLIFE